MSPLPDGCIALLLADTDVHREFARLPSGRIKGDPFGAAGRAKAAIWLFDGEQATREVSFDLLTPFPLFDRCPDGRWIVVSARRRAAADDARLIDPSGIVTGTLRLGDGLEHVQVGKDGSIWCGWFDEGIYGNGDWAYPGREWPPSSAGVAAFDETGICVAEAPRGPTLGGISDCYALNVTGDAAWACTYTEFPILRMDRSGRATFHPTELHGPKALAVQAEHVVAIGSYDRDHVPFTLFALRGDTARVIRKGDLMTRRDQAKHLPDMHGRGPWLHCIEDDVWQRWHIEQFLSGQA